MKVLILADISDHRRFYRIGEVCELPEEQATRWVAAGWAELVDPKVEAAALDAPPETATIHHNPRRRG